MKLKREQIEYLQKRRRDDVGDVFTYDGKILRGIFPDKVDMVKKMFNSNFIKELVENNIFPNSWISDIQVEGYGLVIEHEKIEPIIYPQEWTYGMLKDSALMVLKVAIIAKKYGYNMKDCHGFNVLISNGQPKFIDLGSFHKNKDGVTGWEPYGEFLRFYYYSLYTWADGLSFTSKLSIFSANLTPHVEYFLYKYKFLRLFNPSFLSKFVKFLSAPSYIACWSNEKVKKIENLLIQQVVLIIKKIVDRTNFAQSQNLMKLEKKVKRLKKRNSYSQWAKYHQKISKKEKRFDRLIELINKYFSSVKSAIDIAGNQGKFSEKLLKETNVEKVIVQDLDENAIDTGYKRNQSIKLNISYVNYNAIAPIVKTTHPMPWERFKSDLVISLALLHHLILSQGFALEDILEELKKYTRKYVMVEFMPRGLWTYKQGDNYNVPDWYNIEWFKESFEKNFNLLHYEQVETNYIVFLGKIKD